MKERPFQNWTHGMRSIQYWDPTSSDERFLRMRWRLGRANSFYVSMLWDDVHSALYLGGYQSRDDVIEVSASEETRRKLAFAFGQDQEWNLARGIRDFVQQCGATMVLCRRAVYEIDYMRPTSKAPDEAFRLLEIPRCTYRRRRGRPYQYVPSEIAAERGVPRWIRLDPSTTFDFSFTSRDYRPIDRSINQLVALSPSTLAITDLLMANPNLGIDIKDHEHGLNVALARATRSIGWDARRLFSQGQSETYQLFRALVFRKFVYELRDRVLSRLNELLGEAGTRLGFQAKISLSGVWTIRDIEQGLQALSDGSQSLNELWDLTR